MKRLKDLYFDKDLISKYDRLNEILNQDPNPEWIKSHPYINNYMYLPIEKIEYLLKTIFKRYKIEILSSQVTNMGVTVTVRVHYLDPISGNMDFHDGIGSDPYQISKGQVSHGALAMSTGIAETVAIKDACDKFGKIFGSDINRKTSTAYKADLTLLELAPGHPNWEKAKEALAKGTVTIEQITKSYTISDEHIKELQN